MPNQSLLISTAIKFGWTKTLQFFPFWLGAMAIYLGINFIPQLSQFLVKPFGLPAAQFSIVITIAAALLSYLFGMGLIRVTIDIIDNQNPNFGRLFQEYPKFWRYLGVNILIALIFLLGLLLFIIPGIIWLLMFFFAPYLIIDKNIGVIDALKKSRQMTKGSRWRLLLAVIILFFINILGILAFGIGLLITSPLTLITYAYLYRQLSPSSTPTTPTAPDIPTAPTHNNLAI